MQTTLVAHRLSQGSAPATNWPTETWVIREPDHELPMTPLAQVTLYWYAKDDQWHLWTASIVSKDIKRLGMRLQNARNAGSGGSGTLNF
jgi:hypothetical protein